MTENGGNLEGYFESQPIDSIFNENTFKFDYIKHKLFNIIKVYDKTKNPKGKVLYKKENYPKSVELTIDSKNNISWNNKTIKVNELVKKASDYFSNYHKDNVIFLKTSPQTNYMKYIAVQNELVSAKRNFYNEKSRELYNTEFDNLNEKQKQKIGSNFEIKIYE